MATLNASSLLFINSSISSSSCQKRGIVKATLNTPRRLTDISLPTIRTGESDFHRLSPICVNTLTRNETDPLVMAKLYAILESVTDRVEMHKNIGDQRTNWNSLLLTSINALTLTAATMTGIAAITGSGAPMEALKLTSTSLYIAVTGMLSIMNKIQPSQLAEEQRNATRLFKQLQSQIKTLISIGNPTNVDVKDMMEKVLAIDRAYPLPLLGTMLEKFPTNVEPAVWWPAEQRRKQSRGQNGWNGKLEEEMREIVNVIRTKDEEDYLRLGEKAVKLNEFLAVSGPVLTGIAAVGSAFVGHGDWGVMVGVMGGALASVVNALEHGGQVGMVFEMYRSNAGFFKMMEESIGSNLSEEDFGRRENGELFEMKVSLQLGRSLSQLRNLAADSAVKGGEGNIEEFASKLF